MDIKHSTNIVHNMDIKHSKNIVYCKDIKYSKYIKAHREFQDVML